MSITEFVKFHTAVVTKDEIININSRELGPLFNYSMQTQVDEIYSDRYGLMNFEEFVQGICRVADRVVTKESVHSYGNYEKPKSSLSKQSYQTPKNLSLAQSQSP